MGMNIFNIRSLAFHQMFLVAFLMFPGLVFAQQSQEEHEKRREVQNYLSEAQQALQKDDFVGAEADYRRAISLDPKSETAQYNLGTAYYEKEKNAEAMRRFAKAAATASTKSEKHRAYHNLGNTYMNEKKYQEAVEAYKNALRNNPQDEETRYNLALAKDLLEKNPPPPSEDNQDKEDQQDKNDQQDQQNKDNNQGDKGEDKKDEDKGDEQQKKEKGDKEKDQGKPEQPKDEEGNKPQEQQPVPGQLSPQQVKSLLEAMNNEEKKVQDKINAEKQKGVKVKTDKDW